MYAIIGAGPMGLACARNLQQQGIPFRGSDRHAGPGGLMDTLLTPKRTEETETM